MGGARLATFRGLHLVQGDVRNAACVEEAMRGSTAVVHCAVDVNSAPGVRDEVTIEGTRTVLRAARGQGVRHLVFLSTAAVHSWSAPGRVDEDAPVRGADAYSRSKLRAEALLLENPDVPVSIIRPTCVYGPFSRTWTIAPVSFLRMGIPLVAENSPGSANLIYVDNLVDLIVAALDHKPSSSSVYLANDEQPSQWESLYGAYARTLDVPLHRFHADGSAWDALKQEMSVSWANGRVLVPRLASDMRAPLIAGLKTCHRHVPVLERFDRFLPMDALRRAAAGRTSAAGPGGTPSAGASALRPFAPRELRTFYTSRATISADRARRELGWIPRISAAEAIDRTCAWIKAANL